jgi:Holliday junction resolvase
MTNKNYVRGRSKEYRLKNKLEKAGFIVTRAAGSHSSFDLIAINDDTVRFIQAKPKDFGKKAKVRLLKEHEWVNKSRLCVFEVL